MENQERPFRVEISKPEIVKRVTEVFAVKINVNGMEFGGDPEELIEFFDKLLEHHPIHTQGCELNVTEDFKKTLIKSRVAFTDNGLTFYPTTQFRMIARDLIAGLRSL